MNALYYSDIVEYIYHERRVRVVDQGLPQETEVYYIWAFVLFYSVAIVSLPVS